MKFFGLNINKVTSAEEPVKIKKKQTTEIGDTGIEQSHGYIFDEYNTKLQGEKGVEIYNEMYKSDGTVRSVVRVCSLPVQSAEWFITPASDDKKDKQIADFIERALFEYLDNGWDYTLRHALLSLAYGVMPFEKVFGNATVDGREMIVWKKLSPRMPKSIQSWAVNSGADFGITQSRGDGNTVEIPGKKLMVIVNEREGDNWWGDSILRSAYKHWFFKNTFYKIDAIAFERQGIGIPFAELPEGFSNKDKTAAENITKNMRANAQARLVYPEGMNVGFMDMMARGTRDPEKSIAHHNREITKSVLAQFLELGASGGSGSRAVSSDQSDLFLQALVATAKNVANNFNETIKELVILNYGEQPWYPKLDFSGIIKTDGEKIGKVYSMLAKTGAIIPGNVDERFFREVLKLPFREDDDVRELPETKTKDEDEKEDDDEEFSENNHSKKKVFSAGDKLEGKRKLTFAEKKVDFIALEKEFDKIEDKLDKNGKAILQSARAKYIEKLDKAMKSGDVEAIRKATMGAQKEYEKALAGAMTDGFETGKQSASTEMKIKTPATPAEMTKNIKIQANTIAEAQLAEVTARSKTAYVEAINKEADHIAAIAAANVMARDTVDKLVRNTKDIIVAAHVNYGRDEVFTKNGDKVYALQRSELLDNKTCNYCLSIDGRVIEKNDTFAKNTIFHSGCFVAGTKVKTKNGDENIEDVKVGELVYTHKDNWKPVYHSMARAYVGDILHIELENGEVITCTPDHPFWVNGEWVEAEKLTNESVLSSDISDKE